MKAACIQMNISLCSKHENLERALFLAEEAVSKEAELLAFRKFSQQVFVMTA